MKLMTACAKKSANAPEMMRLIELIPSCNCHKRSLGLDVPFPRGHACLSAQSRL
jgi:hypothetical protein